MEKKPLFHIEINGEKISSEDIPPAMANRIYQMIIHNFKKEQRKKGII